MTNKWNQSMSYKLLDHTADIGLHVSADSMEKIFQEAAIGMLSIAVSGITENETIEEKVIIECTADNWEELLREWLSEINYYLSVHQKIFIQFHILELSETHCIIEAHGKKLEEEKHCYHCEIKAVTYHLLKIWNEQGNWQAQIYFDL
ncbi:MAG: archease [Planctomycetes bacterium]|nr:archease [Planctomycetota bacterium]HPY75282.1 archease [Planctomycetota bacterium]HQB00943.1 archease [Planctomycetota bacterium]